MSSSGAWYFTVAPKNSGKFVRPLFKGLDISII